MATGTCSTTKSSCNFRRKGGNECKHRKISGTRAAMPEQNQHKSGVNSLLDHIPDPYTYNPVLNRVLKSISPPSSHSGVT